MKSLLLLLLIGLFASSAAVHGQSMPNTLNKHFPGGDDSTAAIESLNTKIQEMVVNGSIYNWSAPIRDVLSVEASGVAATLLFAVLIAETVFTGLRIMMGAPVVEQLNRMVVTTIIYFVVSSQLPAAWLPDFRDRISEAGAVVGAQIVSQSNSAQLQANYAAFGGPIDYRYPPTYWLTWMGTPSKPDTYVFSNQSINNRVWGANVAPPTTPGVPVNQGDDSFDFGQMFMTFFFPMHIIGIMVTVATIQLGSVVLPAFAFMAAYVTAIFTYDLLLYLGLMLLPLMYFESFRAQKLWANYLSILLALCLIPCLYFVTSAVGFVFADKLFEALFPSNVADASMGRILSAVFLGAFLEMMDFTGGALSSIWNSPIGGMVEMMLDVFLYLGKFMFGVTIVSAFIGVGVGFSAIAPTMAFRWNNNMGSDEIFGAIQGALLNVQTSISSGFGSFINQALTSGNRATSGIGKGFRPMGK